MINKIRHINIAVTDRCNLKCVMCDIWKENGKSDLPVRIVRKMLDAEYLHDKPDITLTGGEPFLHEGLWPIVDVICKKDPRWLKGLSTNGTLTKKILKFFRDFSGKISSDFFLHISMDGINDHDQQRGKSLAKVLATIHSLKSDYPLVRIKIKFTITQSNYTDIMPTFRFCRENGLDFRIKLAEHAKNYTNRLIRRDFELDEAVKAKVIHDLSEVRREKYEENDRNAGFIAAIIHFLRGKRQGGICETPRQRIFLMPGGDVFSCIHLPAIGNLYAKSLDAIWRAQWERVQKVREDQGCPGCLSYHGTAIRM